MKHNPNIVGIESDESLEDMAVAPGMIAATIVDRNLKGHTAQIDTDFFTRLVHECRQRAKGQAPDKRLALYSGAINYLTNVPEGQLPGIDGAFLLLSNILISIICNPNKQIRRTLLVNIKDMVRKEGRAHLKGILIKDVGLAWMLFEGRDMEMSS